MADAPRSDLSGFADLHLHQFANLAFGGRVLWGSPDGDLHSLGSCREVHGPHGLFDLPGNISKIMLRTGSARSLLGHRTSGSPRFAGWPTWADVTHQTAHQSWLKRAVDGGLRLIVMLAVNSRTLGRISSFGRKGDFTDMTAVDLQLQAAKELEASIDAAAGGPGLGWYRIVYSPEEAETVIASGKLAVVLGIEVDELFGATITADSTEEELAGELDRYYALGVRHVLPIHLFDNVFGGAAFALQIHWSRQGGLLSRVNPFLSLPAFRMDTAADNGNGYRGGHRNRRGLTDLGARLIRLMMAKGMIIDVDHMSAASRDGVLRLAAEAGYPVVAGHAEFAAIAEPAARSERLLTDAELSRVHELGGIVAPILRQMNVSPRAVPGGAGTAHAFLAAYRAVLRVMPDSPIALGTDFNGFAGMPRPRSRGEARVSYPFASPASDAVLDHSDAGGRRFDINADGTAHVGMLPDFIAELSAIGASAGELEPLLRSAPGYVDVWRRAVAAY